MALLHLNRALAYVSAIGDDGASLFALATWFSPSAAQAQASVHLAACFAVGVYVIVESLHARHVEIALLGMPSDDLLRAEAVFKPLFYEFANLWRHGRTPPLVVSSFFRSTFRKDRRVGTIMESVALQLSCDARRGTR